MKLSPPGQLFDVGGCRLHLVSKEIKAAGSELPTVIIESGCGWYSTMYCRVATGVANRLPVITYDRAGLGWSEDQAGITRDAHGAANRLARLLATAKIDGPLLLIGHSIGGHYLRVFAHAFPNRTIGMVLLDASHPQQAELLSVDGFSLPLRLRYLVMAMYARSGLAHFYQPGWPLSLAQLDLLPKAARDEILFLLGKPQTYLTALAESDGAHTAAQQAAVTGDLGDLPLLVITAALRPETNPSERRDRLHWLELQHNLATLSSNSRQRVFDQASHCSLITHPTHAGQVTGAIFDFISACCGIPP